MNGMSEIPVCQTCTCDICGLNPGKVYASGMGPVSYAMCKTCISEGAEILGLICLRLFFHGGPDRVTDRDDGEWWRNSVRTYMDGDYVGWPEIVAAYPEFEASFRVDEELSQLAPSPFGSEP